MCLYDLFFRIDGDDRDWQDPSNNCSEIRSSCLPEPGGSGICESTL